MLSRACNEYVLAGLTQGVVAERVDDLHVYNLPVMRTLVLAFFVLPKAQQAIHVNHMPTGTRNPDRVLVSQVPPANAALVGLQCNLARILLLDLFNLLEACRCVFQVARAQLEHELEETPTMVRVLRVKFLEINFVLFFHSLCGRGFGLALFEELFD